MLTNQEKLDLLNSLEVIDQEGGEDLYVLVENNDKNREVLSKIVPDVDEYVRQVGDSETIDLVLAAFEYADADYYTGSKFKTITKDEAVDLLMKEQEKLRNLKYKLEQLFKELNI